MADVVKPDDEEQQLLDQELQNARRELHALLIAEAYEGVEVNTKSGKRTLLDFTQRNRNVREKIAGGKGLQLDIEAAKTRLVLLTSLYDNYQERYNEWADNLPVPPAADPQEGESG